MECACEQGNQICASQINHAQAVLDQIDAMASDYQDRFKNEIKRGHQVKIIDDAEVARKERIKKSDAEFKRVVRQDTNELLFQ